MTYYNLANHGWAAALKAAKINDYGSHKAWYEPRVTIFLFSLHFPVINMDESHSHSHATFLSTPLLFFAHFFLHAYPVFYESLWEHVFFASLILYAWREQCFQHSSREEKRDFGTQCLLEWFILWYSTAAVALHLFASNMASMLHLLVHLVWLFQSLWSPAHKAWKHSLSLLSLFLLWI